MRLMIRAQRSALLVFMTLLSIVVVLLPQAGRVTAWSGDPTQNTSVCTASGDQQYPQIMSDASGGTIITWCDRRGGTYDIYVQRLNSSGAVQWTANGVAICTASYDQESPQLISDGSGGAIITWCDHRSTADIYAQRVDSSGAVQWTANGVAICTASSDQYRPQLISDGSGGAIITWYDYRTPYTFDIYAQRVNSSGAVQWTANGVAISTASGSQSWPQIMSDGSGGAIITWFDGRSGNDDIYAQRVNSSGAVQWTADGVAVCTAPDEQRFTQLTSDGSGGAIITWRDNRSSSTTGMDIYAQKVNSSGAVQWTANGVAVCTASGGQQYPQITSAASGGAIITWYDNRVSSSDSDVYAQKVNSSGAVQWTGNGVAICTALNDQSYPQIMSDGSGGAIITWYDFRSGTADIYTQKVNSSGAVQWTADGVAICTASGDQQDPQLASDGSGGAIITWMDGRSSSTTGKDIYAQILMSTGTLPDTTPPAVTLSSTATSPTNTSPVLMTATFGETVTGFVLTDIVVGNGTAGSFTPVSGSIYSFNVIPSGQGTVTVDVAAGVAQDAAGNLNTAATQFSIAYDSLAPTVTLSSTATSPTDISPIAMTATFSETVTGFTVGDITVGNGTAGSFAGSGSIYIFTVTPAGQGLVTVNVGAGVAQDAAGNLNTAATQFSIVYGTPPAVIAEDAENITTTAARMKGSLTALGTASSVTVSFVWGTTLGGPYPNETTGQTMTGTGAFYYDLGSLTSGTTYYYEAKAVGNGTAFGAEKTFTTTTSTAAPSVTTDNATSVTTNSARLNGSLTSLGTASSVTVSFVWGTTAGGPYPNETAGQTMTAMGAFYYDLGSLTSGTAYHYKAKAVGNGTSYGTEHGFTAGTAPGTGTLTVTPDERTVTTRQENVQLAGSVASKDKDIAHLYYRVDGASSWVEVSFTDDDGNAKTVSYSFSTFIPRGKQHTVEIKATDAAGNDIGTEFGRVDVTVSSGSKAWVIVVVVVGVAAIGAIAGYVVWRYRAKIKGKATKKVEEAKQKLGE